MIKRQCGVLFLAAEGADEMRLRLNAAVREKCGDMPRAPFRWYETAPVLLQKGAVEKLVAMARQAEASLIAEFGLPLGLIIIDTIAVECRLSAARSRERSRRHTDGDERAEGGGAAAQLLRAGRRSLRQRRWPPAPAAARPRKLPPTWC